MKNNLPRLVVLLAAVLASTELAAKDFFTQARDNLSDGVNTVTETAKKAAPVVAPGASIVIEVANGKSLGDAVKNAATAGPRVVIDGAKALGAADQQIEDAVKSVVGPEAAKAIEIVRLPEKIERAVQIQAAETGLNIVDKGKINPAVVATVPFAAALQQAIDLYKGRAKPIPDTVKTLLATVHSKETLDNARFVIDDNLGSLPGAINSLREKTSDNFAVTVGNIIVFARDPGLTDMHFWAHELQHTVQYKQLGIDGFAAKYATSSSAMEAEAEEAGKRAEVEAAVILSFLRARQQAQN